MSAGYTPGVQRLGIPALQSSDASLGITNQGYRADDKGATALPGIRRRRRELQSGARPRRRGTDRTGSTAARLQRDARRRHQPASRPQERPQLRILLGRSAAQRHSRRRGCQRHPEPERHLDAEALFAQQQRNQPPHARCDHRSGRASRVGSAGVPDRDRAFAAGLDHERLQQDQRPVCRRQQPPAQRTAERRLGLQGLGDVGLGRDAAVGLCAEGPRPGIRGADRPVELGKRTLHRAAAEGLRRRQAAEGAPVGHGAPHAALDVCGRHRQGRSGSRSGHGEAQRRSRSKRRAKASLF